MGELLLMNTRGLRGPLVTKPKVRSVGNFRTAMDPNLVFADGWEAIGPNSYNWEVSRWVSQIFPFLSFFDLPYVNGNTYRIQVVIDLLDGAGGLGILVGASNSVILNTEGYHDVSLVMDASIGNGTRFFVSTEATNNEIQISKIRVTDLG